MALIDRIEITPRSARVGETVCVEVLTRRPKPSEHLGEISVSINGVWGAKQYLQFALPGLKSLAVRAHAKGAPAELVRSKVEITATEHLEFPILRIQHRPDNPTVVSFSLPVPRLTAQLMRAAARQRAKTSAGSAPTPVRRVPPKKWDTEQSVPPYTWDFGDGHVVSTGRVTAEHDYALSLDPDRPVSTFHVSLTVNRNGVAPATVRRTVSIVNVYHLALLRGFVQPRILPDLNATLVMDAPRHYEAAFWVQNLHQEAISLDERRIEAIFGMKPKVTPGAREVAPRRFLDESKAPPVHPRRGIPLPPAALRSVAHSTVVVEPRRMARVQVRVAAALFPKGAVGFAAHYRGRTPSGLKVYASAYFDVPGRFPRAVMDPGALQALEVLAGPRRNKGRRSITAAEIAAGARAPRAAEGISPSSISGLLQAGQQSVPASDLPKVRSGEAPQQGWPCDPWNLPSVIPEGLVCQPTGEKEWRWVPGRFMNALQGDVILSPGDDGPVARMLRSLTPPQYYAHSGIMSRNHSEVTHSTACPDRLKAHPNPEGSETFPTEGFRPDVVKYVWPGVVRQTVEAAVHGEDMQDPDQSWTEDEHLVQNVYTISGFYPESQDSGGQITPALVVKPEPALETPEIRARLREIGAYAAAQEGRSHYRFYCYTDPTVDLNTGAPSEARWAAGTYPSVCSSFVWLCARQAGTLFEGGELEPSDTAPGVEAQLVPGAADGLYHYTAEERVAAGQCLYDYVYDQAVDAAEQKYGAAGDVVVAVTDIADDCANQIANAFAWDWTDTEAKDSDRWKETGDSDCVSPSNILLWDSPALGGLYGYHEPLIYRPTRWEEVQKCTWQMVITAGMLSGTVLYNGQPVVGALVELTGGQFSSITGPSGEFAMVDIPTGPYILTASKTLEDGTFLCTRQPVVVNIIEDQTTTVTVNIEGPDPAYRVVFVDLEVFTMDYELMSAYNPTNTAYGNWPLYVNPGQTHATSPWVKSVADNDVLGMARVSVDLLTDNSNRVNVTLEFRLYDGPTEDCECWADERTKTIAPAPPGHWFGAGWKNGDSMHARVTVFNEIDQS